MAPLLPSPSPLCESPLPLQTDLSGRSCDHLGVTAPTTTLPQRQVPKQQRAPLGCPRFTLRKVAAQARVLPSGVLRQSHETRGSARARVLEDTVCVTEVTAARSGVTAPCPLLLPRRLPATTSPRQRSAPTGRLDVVTQLWVIRELNGACMASETGNGAWHSLSY